MVVVDDHCCRNSSSYRWGGRLKELFAVTGSSLIWMSFLDVCSVFTLLQNFLIYCSAFSTSRAKPCGSSTRTTHSLVLLHFYHPATLCSTFQPASFRTPADFQRLQLILLSLEVARVTFDLLVLTGQPLLRAESPAVPSIPLLFIFCWCSSILPRSTSSSITLIGALSTILGVWSYVKGTTYLLFDFAPTILQICCLTIDFTSQNSFRW